MHNILEYTVKECLFFIKNLRDNILWDYMSLPYIKSGSYFSLNIKLLCPSIYGFWLAHGIFTIFLWIIKQPTNTFLYSDSIICNMSMGRNVFCHPFRIKSCVCLMPFSNILPWYYGGHLYCWPKLVYREKHNLDTSLISLISRYITDKPDITIHHWQTWSHDTSLTNLISRYFTDKPDLTIHHWQTWSHDTSLTNLISRYITDKPDLTMHH
jgi:hypothetical protein